MSNDLSIIQYNGWRKTTTDGAVLFLTILGCFSCYMMITNPNWAYCNNKLLPKLSLMLCAILPPLWFWFEYEFIWFKAPENHRPTLDHIKYGQELSRNIWLAFLGVLLALYFK